ncbi:MAG: peptidylprolyl isomerase [Candidatus Omnitrophica bacterium]|nr:peptidylprolyl isomerase [Candidatus Omnitrophota bacterium]
MTRKALNFFFMFVAAHVLWAATCFSAVVDKVIVVVDGETITQAELDAASTSLIEKLNKELQGEDLARQTEAVKKEVLGRMIEDKLILAQAKKKGIEATDKEIEDKLSQIKSNFDSEERFNEALRVEDVALSDLKQRYADQIKVAKLAEMEVRNKIVIKPTESFDYYNSHTEEFKEPEQIRLKNILIRVEGDLKDEDARLLAEKILGFLKAGEGFDDLALKYSKGPNADMGGDLGFIKKGQMLKEIEDIIFNLDSGQISDVVKTPLGYHIFKVEEKRPERIKEFKEAKDEIEKRLFYEKGKERYQQWIEELKRNAYISYR